RIVAVKQFTLDLPLERLHQLVALFERLIAADLNHHVIAAPIATGLADGAVYLAQESVSAESLDHAVREYGPAPTADAVRVATELAGAPALPARVSHPSRPLPPPTRPPLPPPT